MLGPARLMQLGLTTDGNLSSCTDPITDATSSGREVGFRFSFAIEPESQNAPRTCKLSKHAKAASEAAWLKQNRCQVCLLSLDARAVLEVLDELVYHLDVLPHEHLLWRDVAVEVLSGCKLRSSNDSTRRVHREGHTPNQEAASACVFASRPAAMFAASKAHRLAAANWRCTAQSTHRRCQLQPTCCLPPHQLPQASRRTRPWTHQAALALPGAQPPQSDIQTHSKSIRTRNPDALEIPDAVGIQTHLKPRRSRHPRRMLSPDALGIQAHLKSRR